ncbi:tRNA(ile)-lysidine synthase [Heliomicrobium modesticaldum Ice1]|uniref:tRNA(Ile)-lysidine synthase n=1 Tax=Heliobacterium modesticaldum (strain ATCC 51547 / Ice1) TaxID=498761 RepID=B0TBN4_HELMI|nr:tRNA lysidine(34) synthetase TilS [Heliomicrobium modesticaldum]ABZ83873.1 tRNA(ile)-lysidine synthase [Heliomicrobium modesticaldum Ice1]
MLDQFLQRLHRHRLIEPQQRVLIAVSGGIDSVSLLLLFHQAAPQMDLKLSVAHYNHGLRGEAADEDEAFVAALAGRLGLPCYRERAPQGWWTREPGTKMEAARRLRYDFLERVAKAAGADRIALGHHADDQVETVLFHFLRGSGLRGLAGMPIRRGPYIRPLLAFRRAELAAFLQAERQEWRHDASNDSTLYTRNRIRHELIPLLHDYNPRFAEAIGRMSRLCLDDADYLDEVADRELARLTNEEGLDAKGLEALPRAIGRRVLRRFIEAAAAMPGFEKTEAMLQRLTERGGKSGPVDQVSGHTLVSEAGRLRLYKDLPWKGDGGFYRPLPEPGEPGRWQSVAVPEAGGRMRIARWDRIDDRDPLEPGEREICLKPSVAALGPLVIRSRRPGDWFYPAGGTGRKKVKDYLIDQKTPRSIRQKIPLLTAGEEVLWIIGYRPDRRFLATAATTPIIALRWQGKSI